MKKTISLTATLISAVNCYSANFFLFFKFAAIGAIPGLFYALAQALYPGQFRIEVMILYFIRIVVGIIFLMALMRTVHTVSVEEDHKGFIETLVLGLSSFWSFFWSAAISFLMVFFALVVFTIFLSAFQAQEGSVLLAIMTVVSFLATVGVSAYVASVFGFSLFIVVFEGAGAIEALKESARLTSGVAWKVFLAHVFILLIFVVTVVPFALGFSLLGFPSVFINSVLFIMGVVFFPLVITYYYGLFRDLKQDASSVKISVYES